MKKSTFLCRFPHLNVLKIIKQSEKKIVALILSKVFVMSKIGKMENESREIGTLKSEPYSGGANVNGGTLKIGSTVLVSSSEELVGLPSTTKN